MFFKSPKVIYEAQYHKKKKEKKRKVGRDMYVFKMHQISAVIWLENAQEE